MPVLQRTRKTKTKLLKQLVKDTKTILKQSLKDAISIMKKSPNLLSYLSVLSPPKDHQADLPILEPDP